MRHSLGNRATARRLTALPISCGVPNGQLMGAERLMNLASLITAMTFLARLQCDRPPARHPASETARLSHPGGMLCAMTLSVALQS